MKIAIPVENGRLNSHFGGSRHFCLLDLDVNANTILRSETLEAPEHKPGLFPIWLREHGAEVVIAGGIGQRALSIFAHHGIRVVAGAPNASVESLVAEYLTGRLVSPPTECSHPHEHHAHDHGHHLSTGSGPVHRHAHER
ncbi:MAG TPA: NifB/NifX family molybdenum-iron cluster-binding protein [Clostridia bacterium]|nr:NifB/NifX family molybdenum-iron cluster-binding protein [Clostridia bacterium]